MIYIYKYSRNALIFLLAVCALSCRKGKNDPSIDDQILNYEIPLTPPTRDYIVGAFYVNIGSSFNANIKEVPKTGRYCFPNGVLAPFPVTTVPNTIMSQQIDFAKKAKIDYFVFSVRSANLDFNGYKTDSSTINSFLSDPKSADMKFALSYNLNAGSLGISNTVALESLPVKLEAFYNDFKRMGSAPSSYFKMSNYMKVNGKTLLIINNAYNLNANNSPAIYAELRKRMSALGFELYIIGMQDRWSPPGRFYYRFQNCVDAIYEDNMINTADYDRYYLFAQNVDTGWKYWKELLSSWNIEFVPCISPAYTDRINTPTSRNPIFTREDGGLAYRKFCNVGKRNASASGLILINSFNNWNFDMQLEPAESYGDLYLDITRQEFKLSN